MKIKLDKSAHSENVVRKSLYWFSQYCDWSLTYDSSDWIVQFPDDNAVFLEGQLCRLINDQILRERIDSETLGLRRSIIKKALTDIDEALSEKASAV